MGVIFFLQLSRWLKATSPPQELEVGARRVPYLLVIYTSYDTVHLQFRNCLLIAPLTA